jgi:hypothetical protein
MIRYAISLKKIPLAGGGKAKGSPNMTEKLQ